MFTLLMHINVFSAGFAQRTSSTAPHIIKFSLPNKITPLPTNMHSVLLQNLNWLNSFTWTTKGRNRSKDQQNERLVVPIQHWYLRRYSS